MYYGFFKDGVLQPLGYTEDGRRIEYYDWREDVKGFLDQYKHLKIRAACYKPKDEDECQTD